MSNSPHPADLRVTLLTKRGAERWVRHAYQIRPEVGLGWTPYQVLVTTGYVTAYTAFLTFRTFRQWCRAQGYRLQLNPYRPQGQRSADGWAVRTGSLSRG